MKRYLLIAYAALAFAGSANAGLVDDPSIIVNNLQPATETLAAGLQNTATQLTGTDPAESTSAALGQTVVDTGKALVTGTSQESGLDVALTAYNGNLQALLDPTLTALDTPNAQNLQAIVDPTDLTTIAGNLQPAVNEALTRSGGDVLLARGENFSFSGLGTDLFGAPFVSRGILNGDVIGNKLAPAVLFPVDILLADTRLGPLGGAARFTSLVVFAQGQFLTQALGQNTAVIGNNLGNAGQSFVNPLFTVLDDPTPENIQNLADPNDLTTIVENVQPALSDAYNNGGGFFNPNGETGKQALVSLLQGNLTSGFFTPGAYEAGIKTLTIPAKTLISGTALAGGFFTEGLGLPLTNLERTSGQNTIPSAALAKIEEPLQPVFDAAAPLTDPTVTLIEASSFDAGSSSLPSVDDILAAYGAGSL